MPKPLKLTHKKWVQLLGELAKDYKPSQYLIKSKMKEKLGFTPREYKDYDNENHRWRDNCIMLDFYSEKKRTLMLMKYSEILDKTTQ